MTDKISINSVRDLNTERLLAEAIAEVERLRADLESRLAASHKIENELDADRADLDEAMLLHGGEDGELPVGMRFPEYLDRIAKLRGKWMARRAKRKETQ
jgi:hypothetical protein